MFMFMPRGQNRGSACPSAKAAAGAACAGQGSATKTQSIDSTSYLVHAHRLELMALLVPPLGRLPGQHVQAGRQHHKAGWEHGELPLFGLPWVPPHAHQVPTLAAIVQRRELLLREAGGSAQWRGKRGSGMNFVV